MHKVDTNTLSQLTDINADDLYTRTTTLWRTKTHQNNCVHKISKC